MTWKKIQVGQLGKVVTGKTPKTKIIENFGGDIPFLTPSDDMDSKFSYTTKRTLSEMGVLEVKNQLLPKGTICVSCIGSNLGKVVITTKPTVTNQQINSVVLSSNYDTNFIYYSLKILGEQLKYLSKTSTAVPIINKSMFSSFEINVPSLEEQQKIGKVLSVFDEKIENNRKINHHLEQMAKAIFKEYFIDLTPFDSLVPSDWQVSNLIGIANYLNGLAMQKHRPVDGEIGLPVMKIKELRQGFTDASSDLCSPNIRPDYIIHDGTVIFSWSGSLLVDFWTGGDCGLNQHLFKVTSEAYDKWFYYSWTKHHLDRFVQMAADKATTMGHIKRDALEQAEVLIPNQNDYKKIGLFLEPIYDQIINNRLESRKLVSLRDSLLPKLMSGEISVTNQAAK
ncbi:restriction endonuclease subunit S [Vagococcus lutrae]|uniref:restriction endonuclease subunit S n=1 Tax=Vagococcus lutrae TaxID=81947 RepID=UPI0023A9C104|nr:restriction endonuclease subunit S [Vagococcus lutrae]WEB81026.1 restriction endonuclease subunit S [Vagococcus lutrae]